MYDEFEKSTVGTKVARKNVYQMVLSLTFWDAQNGNIFIALLK